MQENIWDLIKNVEWREEKLWTIFQLEKKWFWNKYEKYWIKLF